MIGCIVFYSRVSIKVVNDLLIDRYKMNYEGMYIKSFLLLFLNEHFNQKNLICI